MYSCTRTHRELNMIVVIWNLCSIDRLQERPSWSMTFHLKRISNLNENLFSDTKNGLTWFRTERNDWYNCSGSHASSIERLVPYPWTGRHPVNLRPGMLSIGISRSPSLKQLSPGWTWLISCCFISIRCLTIWQARINWEIRILENR